MIIDGKNLIAGRLASYAAKQALQGNDVQVINSEQVLVTGSQKDLVKKQRERQQRGHPYKGPFIPTREDRLLRRIIRGMLPFHYARGQTAYRKVKCYIGIPEELKDKKAETVPKSNISKTQTLKYIRLSELCRLSGKK